MGFNIIYPLILICISTVNVARANNNTEIWNIFPQNTDVARTKDHRHWYLNQGVTIRAANVTQATPYKFRTENYKTGCTLSPTEEAQAVINVVDDYGGESPFLPLPGKMSVLNPFVVMLDIAYFQHRPVILTPDLLWHYITKGVTDHINQNAEHFRDLFVMHEGKKKLTVSVDEFTAKELLLNKNEQAWSAVFQQFRENILENTKQKAHRLQHPKFSTTTRVVEDVSIITMMDGLQNYFKYELEILCGIPHVNLLGTSKDWLRLRQSTVSLLKIFENEPEGLNLNWWLNGLIPILNKLYYSYVQPSSKDSVHFMKNIYKNYLHGCGETFRNGWFNAFFPFLEGGQRNFFAGDSLEEHLKTDKVESNLNLISYDISQYKRGISSAPFVLGQYGSEIVDMKFVGGPCCVTELVEGNRAGIPVGSLHVPFGWAVLLSERDAWDYNYHQFVRAMYPDDFQQ